MKRLLATLSAALVVAGAACGLGGCGDKGGSESQSSKPKVDLEGYEFTWATLWDWNNYPEAGASDYGDKRTAWYDQVQKDYNCTIKKVELNADTFYDQVNKAIMAGEKFADFIEVDYSRYQVLRKTDSLMDLSSIEGFDTAQEKFFKTHTDAYTEDGKVYGLQYQYSNRAAGNFLFYNKTLLNSEGCEDPYELVKSNQWTFAKFEEICKKVTKSTTGGAIDQWGLSVVDWHANNFEKPMIFANGGSIIAKDSEGKWTYNLLSTQSQNALNYLYQLEAVDQVLVPADKQGKDATQNFYEGDALFYCGTYDNFASINDNFPEGQEWSIVPLPIGPDADDFINMDTQLRSWVMLGNNVNDASKAATVFDAISEPLYGSVEQDAEEYYNGQLYNVFNGSEEALEMFRLCTEKVVPESSWGMSGSDTIGEAIYSCTRSNAFTPQSAMETISGVITGYIESFFYGPADTVSG